jgi:DNA-binding MarR family transcriptional regulator
MTREAARAFDHIASGDASPAEALATIREAGGTTGKAYGQRVYMALKAVTVRRLTSRRADDANAWIDVIRQSSALLKAQGETAIGERLLVLSDMTADWARTCKAHDLKSVLERPHVLSILEALHAAGGSAKRADLVKRLAVGDANLSRILGTLEGIGLILRDKRKERTVSLTEEGARLAAERFKAYDAAPVLWSLPEAHVERIFERAIKTAKRHVRAASPGVALLAPSTYATHLFGEPASLEPTAHVIRCEVRAPADYEQGWFNANLKTSILYGDGKAGAVFVSRGGTVRDETSGRVLGGKVAPPPEPRSKARHRARD